MRTLFVDVDTQIDFLYPAGALYVPGAEAIVPVVAALNAHAAAHGHLVISTADAHAENDPEFFDWPPHCVTGTVGQQKPASTLLPGHVTVPNAKTAQVPLKAPQIILQKQRLDAFSNPQLKAALDVYQPERCVVYGVVTEVCVLFAVEGLKQRCPRVEVVTDAVRALDEGRASESMRRWESDGVLLVTSASILQ
jgi:nicotinamidase/pyrazinamidase